MEVPRTGVDTDVTVGTWIRSLLLDNRTLGANPILRYRKPSTSRRSLPTLRFPSRYTEIETGPWNITGSFGSDEIRQ